MKYSVSQLISNIKLSLEDDFSQVLVEGEITNLSKSGPGHWYFSLVDDNSLISSALFKFDSFRNPVIKKLKDGDKVLCQGSINVYPPRGTFQLIVKKISICGKGNLKEQFDLLKKKLAVEGLFDLENKKKIPDYPKKVAIITSRQGAALQDFINIYKRRSIFMDILVVPSVMQGDNSPKCIMESLDKVLSISKKKKIDVVVMARGGGSIEDLWAFNNESLVKYISSYQIPIISAVGHQTDFTLSDYVADFRAETPSAAAEILTKNQVLIKDKLPNLKNDLLNLINIIHSRHLTRLQQLNPKLSIEKLTNLFHSYSNRLSKVYFQLKTKDSLNLYNFYLRLDDYLKSMKSSIEKKFMIKKLQLEKNSELLNSLNPDNILERGYTYIMNEKGSVISSYKDYEKLKTHSNLELIMKDGVGKAYKGSIK